jgi:hypothetical protein
MSFPVTFTNFREELADVRFKVPFNWLDANDLSIVEQQRNNAQVIVLFLSQ